MAYRSNSNIVKNIIEIVNFRNSLAYEVIRDEINSTGRKNATAEINKDYYGDEEGY